MYSRVQKLPRVRGGSYTGVVPNLFRQSAFDRPTLIHVGPTGVSGRWLGVNGATTFNAISNQVLGVRYG